VIVGPDGEIRSTGVNGFVRGLEDELHPERLERPEKYFWMEHAERNGIFNAARVGIPLKGCAIFVNFLPCMDCGRAIIQSGITTVIIDKASHEANATARWEADFQRVLVMFGECKIELIWWTE
jgi:dCMP deaminase